MSKKMKVVAIYNQRAEHVAATILSAQESCKDARHALMIFVGADGEVSTWVTDSPPEKIALMAVYASQAASDCAMGLEEECEL